jgi:hypothetical protein
MSLPLLDPRDNTPNPAAGVSGRFILAPPANAKKITPAALGAEIYNPPLQLWIGDNTGVSVEVVPYGLQGDETVTYPIAAGNGGSLIPVLVSQVIAGGSTTAATIIGHW